MKRLTEILGIGLLFLALVLLTTGCAASDDGDEVVVGDSRIVSKGEVIDGKLAIFGGDVVIEEGATVNGDIAVFGGSILIDGTVEGDIANFGGSVTRGEHAVINGQTLAFDGSEGGFKSPQAPERPETPEAPIPPIKPPGEIEKPSFHHSSPSSPADRLFDLIGTIIATILKTIAFGALALVCTLFLPEHVRRVGQAAENAPVASTAVGCVSLPALVLVAIMAAITIIGIPIALLLPFLGFAAAIFGWIGLGFFLGNRLLRAADIRSPRPAAAAAVGSGGLMLASSMIGVIPIIGWVASPLLWMWGLGATILTRGGTRPYPAPPLTKPASTRAFDPLDDIAPAPRAARKSSRSNDLFADLAADLGIEDEIYGDDDQPNRPERPVNPPDGK